MNILILGGYGFIGSHVAQKLHKEGNKLFIVDSLANKEIDKIDIEHVFYELDITDERLEDVFRLNNIDVVLHFALAKNENEKDSKNSWLGLISVLEYSKKYAVKQVICGLSALYAETAKLFDFSGKVVTTQLSIEKSYQLGAVSYCENYAKLHGMNILPVFMSNVYGPKQSSGVFKFLSEKIVQDKPVVIFGNGEQTRDFIYIDDVAEAISRIVSRHYAGKALTISSGEENALSSCVNILRQLKPQLKIETEPKIPDEIDRMIFDNSLCIAELGWKPRHNIKEGLERTLAWFDEKHKKDLQNSKDTDSRSKALGKTIRPYVENLAMFSIMIVLSQFVHDRTTVNPDIGLDYNYIYIMIMGLLYGKNQSIIAIILSSILLSYNIIQKFDDFVSMIYKTEYLVHFASYIFFGVLTGYITDNKNRMYDFLQRDMDILKQRYKFLERIYLENIETKNRLYKQIVNSEDTLGSTYRIVQKLDSIEVENIFTAINEVISEIMNTPHVAVYTIGSNKDYLRQKIRTGYQTIGLPKSIKISDNEYLQTLIKDRQVYVNKMLVPGLPDMAVAVTYNDEVIAIIQLFDLSFEDLNFYNQNLLKITSLLISGALGRAYIHQKETQDKKFIPSTQILNKSEFEKIKREVYKNRRERLISISAFTLEIIATDMELPEISKRVERLVRDDDFIGLAQDDKVNIILWNIDEAMVKEVQKRIKNVGLDSIIKQETDYDF